jgi:F-type H+-transporting ATPase subunit delta
MKITPRKYAQALAQTLEEKEDPKAIIRNLLAFLRRRKQFRLLPKILQAFEEEWSRRRGIVRMRVTYPARFAQSLQELKEYFEKALGKTIEITDKPSETILGGFRVQIDDTLIDASLETRLNALKHRLNS